MPPFSEISPGAPGHLQSSILGLQDAFSTRAIFPRRYNPWCHRYTEIDISVRVFLHNLPSSFILSLSLIVFFNQWFPRGHVWTVPQLIFPALPFYSLMKSYPRVHSWGGSYC